jgi:hypothetical protein
MHWFIQLLFGFVLAFGEDLLLNHSCSQISNGKEGPFFRGFKCSRQQAINCSLLLGYRKASKFDHNVVISHSDTNFKWDPEATYFWKKSWDSKTLNNP